MTESKVMLTTIDNPFDPIEDFSSWRQFDEEKGYYSLAYLARIAKLSDDMSQKEGSVKLHPLLHRAGL